MASRRQIVYCLKDQQLFVTLSKSSRESPEMAAALPRGG
jgi:hypothetical protein